MSTSRDFVDFVLDKLRDRSVFFCTAMFGEYALYAKGKVVGLICDNTLYVKILPASSVLEKECEKDHPYPGAKLHYVITEDQLESIYDLPETLVSISKSLPASKSKRR